MKGKNGEKNCKKSTIEISDDVKIEKWYEMKKWLNR